MTDNTIYDSVFKTMIQKAPKLLIPLINEIFGRSYALDADIVQFSEEHEGLRGTVIDDSVFHLQDKIYHVECQSTPDTDMVVRMIEYDFSIALEEALSAGAPYRLEFPASCVLFLRHTAHTPDYLSMEVSLPDGDSFEYRTRVLKTQLLSEDELFEKQLLILLPYYLMRYENRFTEIAADEQQTAALLADCTELNRRLAETPLAQADSLLHQELLELIIRVSDHLLAADEALQKKVRSAMGGEVLELLNDRAERMKREGVEQGRVEGRVEGRKEGREQRSQEIAARMAELGYSQQAIDEVLAKTDSEGASES